jgi:hypothetical protein
MKKEFLSELRALLEKYNADIFCEMDGDTHGVSQEMVFFINNKEVHRLHGSEIDKFELKKFK